MAGERRQEYSTESARTRNGKQLTRDAALKMYREIERAAGVASLPGRAWYGLRRGTTDVAPSHTTDSRTLNRLGGWSPGSEMREAIYQDGESVEIGARAAAVRDRMRGRAEPSTASAKQSAEAAANEVLANLPESVVRALRDRLIPSLVRRATA